MRFDGVLGLRKPILNNRCSRFPIEPIETVLGTVCTKCGQMVSERFPGQTAVA